MSYRFDKDSEFNEYIYSDHSSISRTKIDEFNKWLKSHKNDKAILFHGTSENIPVLSTDKVIGQGLKRTSARTKKSYQSQTGFVYLSIYPSSAKMFGEMAYPNKKIKVYAINSFQ